MSQLESNTQTDHKVTSLDSIEIGKYVNESTLISEIQIETVIPQSYANIHTGIEMKCIAHNIQYSPFTFGWKIGVADNLSIDPHLGVFASYDYTSKMKESGESISWGDFADYPKVNGEY